MPPSYEKTEITSLPLSDVFLRLPSKDETKKTMYKHCKLVYGTILIKSHLNSSLLSSNLKMIKKSASTENCIYPPKVT